MEYATLEFRFSKLQDDGHTLKSHLMSAWRQSGRKPDELAAQPPLRDEAFHVWEDFIALSGRRGGNGGGPNPLGWGEITDWQRATGTRLRDWELDAILKLDAAYLSETSKMNSKGR